MKRHRHAFEIVGIEHYSFTRGLDETLVKRLCACGATQTERIDGRWTRAELEPRVSRSERANTEAAA